jgi:signal peptidase II
MVWIIVIIILSASDQVIKAVVHHQLQPTDQISVIDGFFYIVRRSNTGAAWSFLANPEWGIYLLSALSIILTSVLIYLLVQVPLVRVRVCLSLVIAGSIGNLIDRIRLGAVTDYLDFHFGSYIFPTFNLADSLIVCGTLALCILLIREQSLLDALFLHKSDEKPGVGRKGENAKNNPDS